MSATGPDVLRLLGADQDGAAVQQQAASPRAEPTMRGVLSSVLVAAVALVAGLVLSVTPIAASSGTGGPGGFRGAPGTGAFPGGPPGAGSPGSPLGASQQPGGSTGRSPVPSTAVRGGSRTDG